MKIASPPNFSGLSRILGNWSAEHICPQPTSAATWRPVPSGTRAASADLYRCPECGQLLLRERTRSLTLVDAD